MMLRKFVLSMAAATLAVAPLAAQAAPAREAAPMTEEESLRGGYVLPVVIGVVLLIVLYLAIDSEEDLPISA
jgi:hypothetical protein